jgi:methionyl-tRNA formyltransferase
MKRRIWREIKRVGWLRFVDVLAFRLYYKLFLSGRDRNWERVTLLSLCARYAPVGAATRILHASSPNAPEVVAFLQECQPDLTMARCKTLLKETVFSIPRQGTFVMHPGICPQYRNAHGCFWALAKRDRDNVGMTLLKIDRGVDTGPVHGYFRCEFNEREVSHHVIQHKVVFDNLDKIGEKLLAIHHGVSQPIPTHGIASAEWGQPWLTAYWQYLWRATGRQALR